MQDNLARTGSNWSGRTPRTMREAFPQHPGSGYIEPTLADKVMDVVAVVGSLAVAGLAFWGVGAYFFGV